MVIEVPEELEAALQAEAVARGVSAEGLVREMLAERLTSAGQTESGLGPFKSSRGILAKYGPAPSAEEIDENRREMFRGFGEQF